MNDTPDEPSERLRVPRIRTGGKGSVYDITDEFLWSFHVCRLVNHSAATVVAKGRRRFNSLFVRASLRRADR